MGFWKNVEVAAYYADKAKYQAMSPAERDAHDAKQKRREARRWVWRYRIKPVLIVLVVLEVLWAYSTRISW